MKIWVNDFKYKYSKSNDMNKHEIYVNEQNYNCNNVNK